MVARKQNSRTSLQRIVAGGSVILGAAWTCVPQGQSSNFTWGAAARQAPAPSLSRTGPTPVDAKKSAPEAAPKAEAASLSSSLPALGASGALLVLSAAGLRASKRAGRQPNQRAAVQRGPWRKKVAEFFGIKWEEQGNLRDGWQALAERAAEVASNPEIATMVAAAKPAKKEEPKEVFDVYKPDTWGNLTMDDVKKYGTAGTVAYVVTELMFWAVAVPTEVGIFYQTAGRWPDFSNDYDKAAVLGFVFAASNIARLCLPLRFGAALAMAPWVDENIINRDKAVKEGSS